MKIPINPQLGVGPPQHRWRSNWTDWLILPFYLVLSTSRDGLRTRPKLRPAHSATFVLLWLLMGWGSLGYAQFEPDKDKDLVAYWSCDELDAQGKLPDLSGNGHDATLHGVNLVLGYEGIPAKVGNSCRFHLGDGNVYYMAVPDHEQLRLTDTSFTLSAWVCQTKRNYNYSGTIFSKKPGWSFSIHGLEADPEVEAKTGHVKYKPKGKGPKLLSKKRSSFVKSGDGITLLLPIAVLTIAQIAKLLYT